MRLNQMFSNVLSFNSIEELTVEVERRSAIRHTALEQATLKNDITLTPKATKEKLTPAEKAILKALGLSTRKVNQLKELING